MGEVTSPPAPFSLRYISWSFLAKSSNTCVDILHQGEERERERERRDGEGIRGESRDEICVKGQERKRRGESAMSWSGNKQMQLLLQSKNSLTVTESRGRNLWASVSITA